MPVCEGHSELDTTKEKLNDLEEHGWKSTSQVFSLQLDTLACTLTVNTLFLIRARKFVFLQKLLRRFGWSATSDTHSVMAELRDTATHEAGASHREEPAPAGGRPATRHTAFHAHPLSQSTNHCDCNSKNHITFYKCDFKRMTFLWKFQILHLGQRMHL